MILILYFKMDYKCKEDFEMKERLKINVTKPQYVQVLILHMRRWIRGMITVAGI